MLRKQLANIAVTLGVALALLALAPFLLPSQRELGIIYFRDKEYERSMELLEAEYRKGVRDVAVVGPLVKLYLQQGEVDQAIGAMEEMERLWPQDPKVLRMLELYYQYAQRLGDRLRILERLRQVDPDREVLRTLSNIYNFEGRYQDQIAVLEELLQRGWGDEKEMVAIVHLRAAAGQPEAAIQDLARFQGARSGEGEALRISLLLDTNQLDQAVAAALGSAALTPAQAVEMFLAKGRGDAALHLLQSRPELARDDPALRWLQAGLLLDAGRARQAYELLAPEQAAGRLPEPGGRLLARALLALGQVGQGVDLLLTLPREGRQQGLLDALEVALEAGLSEQVRRIQGELAAGVAAGRPVLMLRAAHLLGRAEEAEQWQRLALKAYSLSQEDQMALTRVLVERGSGADAQAQLDALLADVRLEPRRLLELVVLYQRIGQVAAAHGQLERARQGRTTSVGVELAWLLAGALVGQGEAGGRWFDSPEGSSLTPEQVQWLDESAREVGAWELAARTAQRLYQARQDLPSLLGLITAQAEAGQEAASDASVALLLRRPLAGPREAARAATVLVELNRAADAMTLLTPYLDQLESHAPLLTAWTRARVATGGAEEARQRLERLVATGQAPPALREVLIDAALKEGHARVALTAATGQLAALPPWLRVAVVRAALEEGEQVQASALLDSLPSDAGGPFTLLRVDLSLRRGELEQARALLQTVQGHAWVEVGEMVWLAQLAVQAGDRPRASAMLAQLHSRSDLADALLPTMASLYLTLGKGEQGLTRLAAMRQERASMAARTAWATLAIGLGRGQEALAWLRQAPFARRDMALLRDLHYATLAAGQGAGALLAARRLIALDDMPRHTVLLLNALLATGEVQEALDLLPKLPDGHPDQHPLNLEVRLAAVRRGLAEPAILRPWIDRELAARQGQALEQLLHDLLAAKAYDLALPRVAELAEQDEAWLETYLAALRQSGRGGQVTGVLLAQGNNPALGEARRRRIAERLLAAGDKESAQGLLQALALHTGPKGADMAQLQFLWGPRPRAGALDWLEERLRQGGGDRYAWGRLLVDAGGGQRVLRLTEGWAAREGFSPPLALLRARASAAEGDKQGMRSELDKLAQTTRQPELLREGLVLARDYVLFDTARQLGEQLLALGAGDADTLKLLGHLAYGREDFGRTREYLDQYLRLRPAGDFESHFYLAECLGRERDSIGAREHYHRSLELIAKEPRPSFFMRHLTGLIYQRLEKYGEAEAVFTELLRANPEHNGVRGDLAETMLLQKSPRRARESLEHNRW